MKKIIGLGAGGSSKVILDILRSDKSPYQITAFLDDDPKKQGKTFEGLPVLGPISNLDQVIKKFDGVINCIGSTRDTQARHRIFRILKKSGFKIYPVLSKKALISKKASLGLGCIVFAGVIVQTGAKLGDNVFLNTGAIVEHDCEIGESSFLSPGCIVSGYTRIGSETFLGSGTVLSGSLSVGSRVTIGAGSVVVRNVPDAVTCMGNPAHHRLKKNQ